jgi:ATP-dependent RNA helicase DHX29
VRVPLVELCLQVKVLELGSIARFLQKAIDPPKDEAVATSVDTLREVGALDDAEELTALGHHLAALPVDVRVGKLLLLGASFGCLDPILTIAAALSYKSPFASSQVGAHRPSTPSAERMSRNLWASFLLMQRPRCVTRDGLEK